MTHLNVEHYWLKLASHTFHSSFSEIILPAHKNGSPLYKKNKNQDNLYKKKINQSKLYNKTYLNSADWYKIQAVLK